MMVKICGITNRDDALAAIEGGASALGFNFYPRSPRYISPERAVELIAELPPGVWKAGVFVNEPRERVAEVASEAGLDVVQLHGTSEAPEGLRVWRAFSVDASFRPEQLRDLDAEACLLDGPFDGSWGGTGKTFDWKRAAGIARKIILAGGLDADNVRVAIETARPWGVDACSRLERAPGMKDHARMLRFLQAALAENGS